MQRIKHLVHTWVFVYEGGTHIEAQNSLGVQDINYIIILHDLLG